MPRMYEPFVLEGERICHLACDAKSKTEKVHELSVKRSDPSVVHCSTCGRDIDPRDARPAFAFEPQKITSDDPGLDDVDEEHEEISYSRARELLRGIIGVYLGRLRVPGPGGLGLRRLDPAWRHGSHPPDGDPGPPGGRQALNYIQCSARLLIPPVHHPSGFAGSPSDEFELADSSRN